MSPLVSVITPTWQRHDVLFSRCIRSVQRQDYENIEHVIVSDGPDPELARRLDGAEDFGVEFYQLDDHDPGVRWGHRARLRGIEEAAGQVIAWLDDDDAWTPRHLAALVPAVPEGGFAYSRAMIHSAGGKQYRIGDGPLAFGRIAPASMIVHDRAILDLETWRDDTGQPDWDLVERWVRRGVPYASVDEVTVDYYINGVDLDAGVPVTIRPLR